MSTLLKQLKGYACDERGKPKRGAVARISEHLECSYSTVRNWFVGDQHGNFFEPSMRYHARIEKLLATTRDISAHRTGPKPQKQKNLSQLKKTPLQAARS